MKFNINDSSVTLKWLTGIWAVILFMVIILKWRVFMILLPFLSLCIIGYIVYLTFKSVGKPILPSLTDTENENRTDKNNNDKQ